MSELRDELANTLRGHRTTRSSTSGIESQALDAKPVDTGATPSTCLVLEPPLDAVLHAATRATAERDAFWTERVGILQEAARRERQELVKQLERARNEIALMHRSQWSAIEYEAVQMMTKNSRQRNNHILDEDQAPVSLASQTMDMIKRGSHQTAPHHSESPVHSTSYPYSTQCRSNHKPAHSQLEDAWERFYRHGSDTALHAALLSSAGL